MRALALTPGKKGSLGVREVPEPAESDGAVLVEGLEVGLCGTDAEITSGAYGEAPPGQDHLVLGHENLGRVVEAPDGCGLSSGDLVVGIVRRPDPVPCAACAAGEWDMCRNGLFTEHGISGLDGFAREHWRADADAMVRIDPALRDVGVLLEPTTILAKAWEQTERIGARAYWAPRTVAVTGAGPVGLLAALLAVQRGYEVHVYDVVHSGPKVDLVRDLGATFHDEPLPDSGIEADITMECTGVGSVILDAMACAARDGVVCLTGVSTPGGAMELEVGTWNRRAVLRNEVVFGSVNANRRHYEAGVDALAQADRDWLRRMISRRVPLADFAEAFDHREDDVKVVLDLTQGAA